MNKTVLVCGMSKCKEIPDFRIVWKISNNYTDLCEGHYREIVTGEYVRVKSLTGKSLQKNDEVLPESGNFKPKKKWGGYWLAEE